LDLFHDETIVAKKQKNRKRHKAGKRRNLYPKNAEALEGQFVIETANGIEIARAYRTVEDRVSAEGAQDLVGLSELALRQFAKDGRGGFLMIFDVKPNEAVYLEASRLGECIKELVPEATKAVTTVMNDYDPQKQFVMVNVFSRRRIAITIDALRSSN
jgi:hypothetical protein